MILCMTVFHLNFSTTATSVPPVKMMPFVNVHTKCLLNLLLFFFLAYPIKVLFLFVPFLYPFLYFASYLTVSLLYRETASYISEALEKGKVLNSMLY